MICMRRAVIFDFDGTLVNLNQDADTIREKLRDISKKYGYVDLKFDRILDDIEEAGKLNTHLKQELIEILNEEDMKLIDKAEIIDSSPQICSILKNRNYLIGIFSRNYSKAINLLLDKFSFPKFDMVLGRYEGGKNKREQLNYILLNFDLDPNRTIVVGDHVIDIVTAKKEECYAIGVESGRFNRYKLLQMGADEVIKDIGEIFSVIK